MRLPARLLFPAALLVAGVQSCGYEIGNLYEVRDLRVDQFQNDSDRRTPEFELTNVVVHEIAARGIRVNHKEAPVVLRGRILDIRTPSLVDEKNTDSVLVGSLVYRVEVRLVTAEGVDVWREERVESTTLTGSRGETLETARQKLFDRLARWVVSRLEKDW